VTAAPWLSIVIPTVGRASLVDTLDAIDHQPERLMAGVEVVVVADTYAGGMTPNLDQAKDHIATERQLGRYRFIEHDGGQHVYGQPQRTAGARAARGDWVWFGQDDNVAAENALTAIYDAVRSHISELLIFRWVSPWREVIWRYPELALGNLDADCLVMSRNLAQQVTWGLRYEGDFDAARQAFELTGRAEPDWRPPIISIARPDEGYRWWR
jgi:hypothetical protein